MPSSLIRPWYNQTLAIDFALALGAESAKYYNAEGGGFVVINKTVHIFTLGDRLG